MDQFDALFGPLRMHIAWSARCALYTVSCAIIVRDTLDKLINLPLSAMCDKARE